jgi:hypothetical protein
MKTDNELIAEFMGIRHRKQYGIMGDTEWTEVEVTYRTSIAEWQSAKWDKSWDWLMPVVEKIDGIYDYDRSMYNRVVELPVSTPINEVYKAVVQFITWYNENKKRYPL